MIRADTFGKLATSSKLMPMGRNVQVSDTTGAD